jgi:sigma-E factor negative regulatory protein RseC
VALLLEEGTVVGIDGKMARVRVARGAACGGCSSQGACSPLEPTGQEMVIRVENRLHARPGQRVVVGIDDRVVLRGAAWVYMLPLATFFAGYWLGARLLPVGEGELGGVAGAVLGLVGGLALVARRFRPGRAADAYRPRMVKAL